MNNAMAFFILIPSFCRQRVTAFILFA